MYLRWSWVKHGGGRGSRPHATLKQQATAHARKEETEGRNWSATSAKEESQLLEWIQRVVSSALQEKGKEARNQDSHAIQIKYDPKIPLDLGPLAGKL